MSIELPKQHTPEEIEEFNKNRERYDNLDEDFKYDLAKEEDDWREKLSEADKEKFVDDLTGLRNRNALNAEIPQMLILQKRAEKYPSIIILDLDKFKDINDIHGHLAGDQTLKTFSQILEKNVKKSDIVYRYGGDEMIIFVPDANIMQIQEIAERIRVDVEKTSIELKDESGKNIRVNLTASIGCANASKISEFIDKSNISKELAEIIRDKLIKAADDAMYESKQFGRNLVTVFSKKV